MSSYHEKKHEKKLGEKTQTQGIMYIMNKWEI